VLVEERELMAHGWFVESSLGNYEENIVKETDASGPPALVDAVGEPVEFRKKMNKPEVVWGAETARTVKHRLEQARKFRIWAL